MTRDEPNAGAPVDSGAPALPSGSPLLCEHANENPHVCPCPPGCYCKGRTCAALPSGALDSGLLRFATDLQREALEALNAHGGNQTHAAAALGIPRSTLTDRIALLRRKAARAGYSPAHDMAHTVPDGFHVKGVSTLYRADGTIATQWVKSAKDLDNKFEILREAMQAAVEPFCDRFDPVPPPVGELPDDLLTAIPMGDPHLGMLAWAVETGADFDLAIAERNMCTAVDRLVSLAPASREAWLINLGDFFHTDNGSNRTTRSGHALDVDSRYFKMCTVGLRAILRCIDRMLEKFARVRVTNEIGNHDDYSAMWLSLALDLAYRREPRVVIDTAPTWAHWYRFGNCFFGTTHGHGPRHASLGEIMATDRPQDWGEATYRHWYVGHVHHDSTKDRLGCTIETMRTLAGRDAWATREGYRAMRDMKLDVWHRTRGKILRHTIGVEEVEGIARDAARNAG